MRVRNDAVAPLASVKRVREDRGDDAATTQESKNERRRRRDAKERTNGDPRNVHIDEVV